MGCPPRGTPMLPCLLSRQSWRLAVFAIVAVSSPLCGRLSAQIQISGASTAPTYSSQSVVNAATQLAQHLAPNAIATLYGANLAFSTRATAKADIVGGTLPVSLDGV